MLGMIKVIKKIIGKIQNRKVLLLKVMKRKKESENRSELSG
jgi:hypothetical protein